MWGGNARGGRGPSIVGTGWRGGPVHTSGSPEAAPEVPQGPDGTITYYLSAPVGGRILILDATVRGWGTFWAVTRVPEASPGRFQWEKYRRSPPPTEIPPPRLLMDGEYQVPPGPTRPCRGPPNPSRPYQTPPDPPDHTRAHQAIPDPTRPCKSPTRPHQNPPATPQDLTRPYQNPLFRGLPRSLADPTRPTRPPDPAWYQILQNLPDTIPTRPLRDPTRLHQIPQGPTLPDPYQTQPDSKKPY